MNLQPAVERELIRKCRTGDTRYYEPLVKAYEPSALRVADGLLGDFDDASDAVQEAFIKAYRSLPRFDLARPFGPWFFQILRNHCRDILRARKARGGMAVREDGPDWHAERGPLGPERHRERSAARRLVWAGLDRIGTEHREVLVLKELEGFRYQEIAEILSIPEGTVASRLFHARRALKEALEALGGGT